MPTGHPLPDGWEGAFFAAIGRGESVTNSCRLANVSPAAVYRRRKNDEAFAAQWAAAIDVACDDIRDDIRSISKNPEHKWQFAALLKRAEWYLPEARAQRPADENGGLNSDRIAEALERFTTTVVSLAERGRAALPAGEPD